MSKHQIRTNTVGEPAGHFSQAILIEGRGKPVFISSMTARRPDGTIAGIADIEEQTRQVCENIKSAVEAAGGTMDDICRVEVYVRSMGDRERINKVRRQFFRAPPPASTVAEVARLASPEFLVEMSAIAVVQTG